MSNNNSNEQMLFKLMLAGVGYLVVVRPVLEYLGIAKGAGTKAYENENVDPGSPLGVSYWRNFYYTANTAPNGRKPITQSMIDRAKKAAEVMYNAFGLFSDNEDEVIRAIQLCSTKAMVSLMSFFLSQNHNTSLLGILKYGMNTLPENGLDEKELENIINMVRALPQI